METSKTSMFSLVSKVSSTTCSQCCVRQLHLQAYPLPQLRASRQEVPPLQGCEHLPPSLIHTQDADKMQSQTEQSVTQQVQVQVQVQLRLSQNSHTVAALRE